MIKLPFADIDTLDSVARHNLEFGLPPGKSTGWEGFDKLFMIPPEGQLNVVTGTPGSGKSEWLDTIAVYMAATYGWKIFVYSPENYPANFYYQKIAEKFVIKITPINN